MLLLRRSQALLAFVLTAAATLGAGTGQAQPGLGDETALLRERVEAASEADPRSAELIDPLTALGLLYHEQDNPALAIATIASAIDIVRINFGLHSLDQVPLMRHLIDIQLTRGDTGAAWDIEQELIELAHANPDNPRAGELLREIGDARIALLEAYLSGELPPQIFHGCYYEAPQTVIKDCTSGSKRVAARHLLLEAREHYDAAIAAMRHGGESEATIAALEQRLLRTNAVYGRYLQPPMRDEFGRERLEAIYRQSVDDGAPVDAQIEALIDIADWELSYSRNQPALDLYMEAYAILSGQSPGHWLIGELFVPDVPVILPAFLPNPLDSEESDETIGYVDIEFEISRFGRSRKIEVVHASEGVPVTVVERLERVIASNRFRPRAPEGRFGETTATRLRYYVDGSRAEE